MREEQPPNVSGVARRFAMAAPSLSTASLRSRRPGMLFAAIALACVLGVWWASFPRKIDTPVSYAGAAKGVAPHCAWTPFSLGERMVAGLEAALNSLHVPGLSAPVDAVASREFSSKNESILNTVC